MRSAIWLLGFIQGNCCPHYDEENERRPAVAKFLLEQHINSCIAIEGECAIHMKDGKVFSSVAFCKEKNSYSVSLKNNKVIETQLNSIDISVD